MTTRISHHPIDVAKALFFFMKPNAKKVTHQILYLPVVQSLEYSQQQNMESGGHHCLIFFFCPQQLCSGAGLQSQLEVLESWSFPIYPRIRELIVCHSTEGGTSVSQWESWVQPGKLEIRNENTL